MHNHKHEFCLHQHMRVTFALKRCVSPFITTFYAWSKFQLKISSNSTDQLGVTHRGFKYYQRISKVSHDTIFDGCYLSSVSVQLQ